MTTPAHGDEHARAIRRFVAWQAGLIDEDQAREARAHVETCAECREHAELPEAADAHGAAHLPADLIARWPVASRNLHGLERELVETHLRDCTECRADLELLGHALALRPEAATAPEPARGRAEPDSRAKIIRMTPRRVIWREWVLGGYAAAATAVCAFLMFTNTAIFGPVAPLVPQLATSTESSPTPSSPTTPPPKTTAETPVPLPGATVPPAPSYPRAGTAEPEMLLVLVAVIDLGDEATRGTDDGRRSPGDSAPVRILRVRDDQTVLQIVHPEMIGGYSTPATARVKITVVRPSGRELPPVYCWGEDLAAQRTLVTFPSRRIETGDYTVRYQFEEPAYRREDIVERFRVERDPR